MPKIETKCKGEVKESLGNQKFRIGLENGYIVMGYLSGKMNLHKIKVLVGDKVEMVHPEYGEIFRITKRL